MWWFGSLQLLQHKKEDSSFFADSKLNLLSVTSPSPSEEFGLIVVSCFSCFNKALSVAIYVILYVKKLPSLCNKIKFQNILQYSDVNSIAKSLLLQSDHSIWFQSEILHLQTNNSVHISSRLKTLNVILADNVLYLKTRFALVDDLPDKIPILHPDSHLQCIIIRKFHNDCLHQGTAQTFSNIRHHYWVLRGKKTVHRIISKCVVCKRLSGKPYSVNQYAPLPTFRLKDTLPFVDIGIDFALI